MNGAQGGKELCSILKSQKMSPSLTASQQASLSSRDINIHQLVET